MLKQISLMTMIIVLSACSHHATTGQLIQSQEEHIQDISRRWQMGNEQVKKGNKSIQTGERLVRKGKALIEKGHYKITKGKRMIKEGEKMMKQSQKTFEKEFPSQDEE